ncbi:MAG: Hsp70 family protein [Myxococcota bacterium]
MKSAPVLGIDLGTTNSVVAVAGEGAIRVLPPREGEKLLPSVVSFHPNGDVLVGASARDRRLLDAHNTVYSVKRLIGRPFDSEEVRRAKSRFPFPLEQSATGGVLVRARGETYTLSEISAFVLREVRAISENALGVPCSRAVITVPANFNELQRSATKAAGRVAGLEVLRILNEPTAAALAYGYGKGSHERIAIFDLGGGTFDVTILELAGEVFEVLATAGDTYLGGDDIDALIAEQMAEAFLAHHRYDPRQDQQAFERLRAAAEWSKCQLSNEPEVQLRVEELAYGEGGVSLDLTFGLTRQGLEAMAMPLLARAFDVCEEAMSVAGIRPTQLDNVILVGGSTRMPLVHSMVEEYFGRPPLSNVDPDLVVAQGAAIQAQALATSRAKGRLGRVRLEKVRRGTGRRIGVAVEQSTAQHRSFDDQPTVVRSSEAPPVPSSGGRPPPVPPPPPPAAAAAAHMDEPTRTTTIPGTSPMRMAKPTETETGLPPVPPPPPPEPSSVIMSQVAAIGAPADASAPLLFDMGGAPDPALAPPTLDPLAFDGPTEETHLTDGLPPGLPAPDLAPPADFAPGAAPGLGLSPSSFPNEPPPEVAPPLLLDVTPLSLGVETVSGYCEHIIGRNSAIPTEQTRVFSTGQDDQTEVVVRICQGESRRLEENQLLGEVVLSGLAPAARGAVPIEVTFVLDADGTLGVRAVDKQTGHQQHIRISLIGGVEDGNIDEMQARLEQRYGGPQ